MTLINSERIQTTVREMEYDDSGRMTKETVTVTSGLTETQTEEKE